MEEWPKYFRERLWLGNTETGNVGIVTLWTPKERVVEMLSDELKKRVAIVGQLYSKRGIEYIFRNIWLRPQINYLVVWGTDLTESGKLLTSQDLEGYLKKIFKEGVEQFLENVEIINLIGKDVEEFNNLKFKNLRKWGEKREFKENKSVAKCFPSENSVFRIEGETIGETWLQILKTVTKFGKTIPRIKVYGGMEKTVLNLVAVVTGEDIKNPKMWSFFDFDKESLRGYFKNFFSPERGEEAYTYGERLFAYEVEGKKIDQIELMVQKMRSFAYNKGAVAMLWQPQIDNYPIRKPWRTPCLTLIQGMCLEDKFFLTAYFRSNDMFGAWPQNAFALRKLQTEMALKLKMVLVI